MAGICPECRNNGKEVRNQTVNNLTKGETDTKENDEYYICLDLINGDILTENTLRELEISSLIILN